MFAQKKKKRHPDYDAWKRSEGGLRIKSSVGAEQKKTLTGYASHQEKKDRLKESLRLENSYGTIAFGGDRRRGLAILVSEKRRHNSPAITEKEKQLRESRQVRRPLGNGRVITNPGGQREGAFMFSHHPGDSRFEIMERMKQYLAANEQESVQRMMPFTRAGAKPQPMQQLEQEFSQRLAAAMKDVKKEPPDNQAAKHELVPSLLGALRQQDEVVEAEGEDEEQIDG